MGYNLIVKTPDLGTVMLGEQWTQCTLASLEATGNLPSEKSWKSLRSTIKQSGYSSICKKIVFRN